jgi:hypothetical protein
MKLPEKSANDQPRPGREVFFPARGRRRILGVSKRFGFDLPPARGIYGSVLSDASELRYLETRLADPKNIEANSNGANDNGANDNGVKTNGAKTLEKTLAPKNRGAKKQGDRETRGPPTLFG